MSSKYKFGDGRDMGDAKHNVGTDKFVGRSFCQILLHSLETFTVCLRIPQCLNIKVYATLKIANPKNNAPTYEYVFM